MKKGFTLVEVMVSIALFSLIMLLMFGSIDNLREQHRFYDAKERELSEKNRLLALLRHDFDRATSLNLLQDSNNRYTIASISGANHSLYGINEPYVTWLVLKDERRLIRIESPAPINLPIAEKSLYQIHVDSIKNDCKTFRIHESPKNRLIHLDFESGSPILLEVSK